MRVLSGIQSSGKLHIGNYFGAIAQFLELQHQAECFIFIADLHALTTLRDGDKLRGLTRDVALDYLALGLDPSKVALFRQSDIPEVTELLWILLSVTPMGLLERAVSYKDKLAHGISADAGLFTYPVLMAADILAYDSDEVPVGKDQIQHLEMARDIAIKLNAAFDPKYLHRLNEATAAAKAKGAAEHVSAPGLLKLPRARIQESRAVVPGLDGQKMSKSYGNTIDLFADDASTKKRIMSIKTDSTPVEAPKDPNATPVHALLKLFASVEEMAEIDRTFREGGKGYGHYKQRLAELFFEKFGEARKNRLELEKDPERVERVLRDGAERARAAAAPVMDRVRRAVGLR
ncbi:MAG TPA: tryptophan--tRNA ligase [Polyangiaceae bacterium]|nr:tryptophan--tRNA ligase [Polyangiaceae bacterium]